MGIKRRSHRTVSLFGSQSYYLQKYSYQCAGLFFPSFCSLGAFDHYLLNYLFWCWGAQIHEFNTSVYIAGPCFSTDFLFDRQITEGCKKQLKRPLTAQKTPSAREALFQTKNS